MGYANNEHHPSASLDSTGCQSEPFERERTIAVVVHEGQGSI